MRDRARLNDLKKFYKALAALSGPVGGPRSLRNCNGSWAGSKPGVYLFMEDGELRSQTGKGPRIVRRQPLETPLHTGGRTTGECNHRGSIFRLIVGTALIK